MGKKDSRLSPSLSLLWITKKKHVYGMGDIFTHPIQDAVMRKVVSPPPGLLENTLGGVALAIERDYAMLRATNPPSHVPKRSDLFLRRLDSVLANIRRDHPRVEECCDPSVNAAVVYQRLRLRRHAILRYSLRILVTRFRRMGNAGQGFPCHFVDEYNRLASRVKRPGQLASVADDAAHLRRRVDAHTVNAYDHSQALRYLSSLLRHLYDDIRLYRRRGPPVVPPPSSPPPREAARTPMAVASAVSSVPSPPPPVGPPPTDTECVDCVICMDQPCLPRLPCGHKVMCTDCAASVDKCPICRLKFCPSRVHWQDPASESFIPPV
jgi:hypothetical protein